MVTRISLTKWTMMGIAFLVIIGLLGITVMLFFFHLNPDIRDIMMLLIGSLITNASIIVRYYFRKLLPKPKTNTLTTCS